MEKLQIIIEGVSEEQIQKDIERMTKGWRLFFHEPEHVDYEFFNPFWGRQWDGTAENLRELILQGDCIKGHHKHCVITFDYNGVQRFAYCTWTKQVYDFTTKKYYELEAPKLATKITEIINKVMAA